MGIWHGIRDSLTELKEALKQSWVEAGAKAPSFAHLSENERVIPESIYDGFLDKAGRGYFDEDITRDFRRFLFRFDFDKANIDSATRYMHQIAEQANLNNRGTYRTTQDRFWEATGLSDTRESVQTPFIPRTPPF